LRNRIIRLAGDAPSECFSRGLLASQPDIVFVLVVEKMADIDSDTRPPKLSIWQWILQRYGWMRLRNKIALWVLVGFAVVFASSVIWALPAYRTARTVFYLNMGERLAEQKNLAGASLAFRKAMLAGGYRQVWAWERLLKFLEGLDSPEVVAVWGKIADLEPENLTPRYRQAKAAMRFGKRVEASEILERVPEEHRSDAGYLEVAAVIAMEKRDFAQAIADYERAVEAEPGNAELKLQLARARGFSSDSSVRVSAMEDLTGMAKGSGAFAASALRTLIDLAIAQGQLYEADRLASRLIERPDGTVADRLRHLDLEIASNSLSLPVTVEALETYAEEHPEDMERITGALLEKGAVASLRQWEARLPEGVRATPDAQRSLLRIALALGDWKKVFAILSSGASGYDVNLEAIAMAQKAFDQYEAGDPGAEQTWANAIYTSGSNLVALNILTVLADSRGWRRALGRSLWALATANPGNFEAWRRIVAHESKSGNLAGCYAALTAMANIDPNHLQAVSQWVTASFLLRKGDRRQLLETARRLYSASEPAEPMVATAYALALLGAEQPEEALDVFMRIPEKERLAPERSMYFGAVLAANGRSDAALRYLAGAPAALDDFPEESGFRRIWASVARGEPTARQEVDRILSGKATWADQAKDIARRLQSQIEVREQSGESTRILEELQAGSKNRERMPQEVREFLQEIREGTSKKEP